MNFLRFFQFKCVAHNYIFYITSTIKCFYIFSNISFQTFLEIAGGCWFSVAANLPEEIVGNVNVGLCSSQQEHDEGILQVTLKL